ncbi:MAG: hypothetical protein E7505_01070 [Ruminococcus sp.]|nr:hypothetical protein [Ruminococcus sp.]
MMNRIKRKQQERKQQMILLVVLCAVFILVVTAIVKIIAKEAVSVMVDPGPYTVEHLKVSFNPYADRGFFAEKGIRRYSYEGITSKAGIDVSYAQKEIDWNKVKASGIDFAMVRLGFRGYESGKLNLDEFFEKNMNGAAAAGIGTGVYFFSQAISEKEAIEEADFVIEKLRDYDITYPVAFDWEVISEADARTDNISQETLNSCALAFCRRIEEAGYKPIIYASLNLLREHFQKYDVEIISDYDLWLAEYKDFPEYPYDFRMWQYTDEGIIDGIDYETDLNILFEFS